MIHLIHFKCSRFSVATFALCVAMAPLVSHSHEPYASPAYGARLPYPYGSVVSGPVGLYPRVKLEDCHKIAPGAVPVIVAVKDPNICRKHCRCCLPQCVYVQVFVPPCPLLRVKVNKHGDEIELDYGKYEVDIDSENGVVEIDYDN